MLYSLIIIAIAVFLLKKFVLPKMSERLTEVNFDASEGIDPKMRAARDAQHEAAEKAAKQPFDPEYKLKDADKLAAERAALKAKNANKA